MVVGTFSFVECHNHLGAKTQLSDLNSGQIDTHKKAAGPNLVKLFDKNHLMVTMHLLRRTVKIVTFECVQQINNRYTIHQRMKPSWDGESSNSCVWTSL